LEAPFEPSTVTRDGGHRRFSHKNIRLQGIFPLTSASLIKLMLLVGQFLVNGGFSGKIPCKVPCKLKLLVGEGNARY
jgi:hypothetical protein